MNKLCVKQRSFVNIVIHSKKIYLLRFSGKLRFPATPPVGVKLDCQKGADPDRSLPRWLAPRAAVSGDSRGGVRRQ